jgi:uncharacterized protein (TIGR03437 family)
MMRRLTLASASWVRSRLRPLGLGILTLGLIEISSNSLFFRNVGSSGGDVCPAPRSPVHAPLAAGLATKDGPAKITGNRKARLVEPYGNLPLSFEANHGQTDGRVQFLSRGRGYTLFLTATEAVLARDGSAVRMKFKGANPAPRITGVDQLAGSSNYFIGNDPGKWRTAVPTYGKVRYESLYPGVDLVFRGTHGRLEYDFLIAPGADPSLIRLAFEGADKLEVEARGDLVVHAGGGELRFRRPLVYQEVEGVRREVAASYVLEGYAGGPAKAGPYTAPYTARATLVGFQVAAYDASKPLIIDPVLAYSTYLGGSGQDRGYGIAVDSSGNAYVTGCTSSSNFPTANALQASFGGNWDAFVTKLNAAGSALVYSTYLGGNGVDVGNWIALDSSGNAYVTGETKSSNFPTANALQASFGGGVWDAFVTKLDAAGSALVYSTYLGGNGADGAEDVAVDSSGSAYVTGYTDSSNFPTGNPLQASYGGGSYDAFVAKLNAAGSALVYSTYLGGNGYEWGDGIAVDSSDNAYVAGFTDSSNFPTANPLQASSRGGMDVFVTKLNAAGSALVYSTYLGGSGGDWAYVIAVDSSGNGYVTGCTSSSNFPTANALQASYGGGDADVFVAKLNPAGSALVYSTYLGGNGYDWVEGMAVDSSGNAYVVGRTDSSNFPTANALQASFGGVGDAFVTKLNAAGSALLYSTHLGGNGDDWGTGIAVDSSGNAYVTGATQSGNFPMAAALQPGYGGGAYDAFIAKISDLAVAPPNPVPVAASLSPASITAGAAGFTLTGNGSDFVAGAVVRWNGSDRATTFVSSTQLTAAIPASDVATVGTAQVTVFNPAPGGGTSAALTFTINPAGVPPAINTGGVINGASLAPGQAVTGGAIGSLFGSNLATAIAVADGLPLPTTLGGVTMRLNGIAAPLFFVSPTQINFQFPWELLGQRQASVTVTLRDATSNPMSVALAAFGPGLFATNSAGSGQGAILIAASGEVAAPTGSIPGRATRPARRGEYVSIFCTGLGAVTNQPASGDPASGNPLSTTTTMPTVTIGGTSAPVSFSGLAPGFVGLYQVNAQVPGSASTGNAVPVVVSIGGSASNTVTMAVLSDGTGALTAPRPIAPVDNTAIRQNDPASGCTADPTKGAGYRIRFEWSGPPAGEQVAGYELWAARGTAAPLLNAQVPLQAAYVLQRCGEFIADDSPEGWEWRVRARDARSNFSPWSSTARFRFEPCRLADGRPCGTPQKYGGSFAPLVR